MSQILYIFVLFLIAVGFTESNHIKCPFEIMGTRKNCYREESFKKLLDSRPKYRNTRPNILINENTTIAELENLEKCCYERVCLYDCGYGGDYLANSYYGRNMPQNLKELTVEYYSFFKTFKMSEIDQLLDGTAEAHILENWRVKLFELSNYRGRIRRRQRLEEGNSNSEEDN